MNHDIVLDFALLGGETYTSTNACTDLGMEFFDKYYGPGAVWVEIPDEEVDNMLLAAVSFGCTISEGKGQ